MYCQQTGQSPNGKTSNSRSPENHRNNDHNQSPPNRRLISHLYKHGRALTEQAHWISRRYAVHPTAAYPLYVDQCYTYYSDYCQTQRALRDRSHSMIERPATVTGQEIGQSAMMSHSQGWKATQWINAAGFVGRLAVIDPRRRSRPRSQPQPRKRIGSSKDDNTLGHRRLRAHLPVDDYQFDSDSLAYIYKKMVAERCNLWTGTGFQTHIQSVEEQDTDRRQAISANTGNTQTTNTGPPGTDLSASGGHAVASNGKIVYEDSEFPELKDILGDLPTYCTQAEVDSITGLTDQDYLKLSPSWGLEPAAGNVSLPVTDCRLVSETEGTCPDAEAPEE